MTLTVNKRIQIIVNELYNRKAIGLCRDAGLPQTSLSSVLGERQSEPSLANLLKIYYAVEKKGISLDWLITGEGEMYNSGLSNEKLKGFIPYYANLPSSAGRMGLSGINQNEMPTGYMSIPNVSAERLFPVVGCSMLPKIKPGDIIGVNSVNKWDRVEPDKIYMIITLEDRMIKRLRIDINDNEILWCISENENFKEFPINKSEIKYIYHVVYHGEIL